MNQPLSLPPNTTGPDRLSRRTAAVAAGIAALVPYLLTMNRTIGFVDKGELATAACTLGVPHPTGYPTLMLLGYAWTHLLFFIRPILALNLLSALLCALSVGALTVLYDMMMGGMVSSEGEGGPPALPVRYRRLCAALAALATGMTGMWWEQANGFEVYALHLFLLPVVTTLFLCYVDHESAPENEAPVGFTRRGSAFALVLGLSFSNHLTTVLLAPAFLLWYFTRLGLNGRAFLRWLYLAPFFLLGLLPYLLLPLAASHYPWVNWGLPDSPARFFDHVSGRDYHTRLFAGMTIFGQQTRYFFSVLPAQFGYAGLLPVILGIVALARHHRTALGATLLLFFTGFVYGSNYNAYDVDSYFLPSMFACGILSCFGLWWLAQRTGTKAALILGGLCVIMTLGFNYRESDESGNRLVEDLTLNMLSTLPKNAVVITGQWNFWMSASLYMQQVEHRRPDLLIINRNLFDDIWYWDVLERHHPEITRPLRSELNAFRAAVKGNRQGTVDQKTLEQYFTQLVQSFIDSQITVRPVCLSTDMEPGIGARYHRVPYQLVFLLVDDPTVYVPQQMPAYRWHPWNHPFDPYRTMLSQIYFVALANRARYEHDMGNDDLWRSYRRYALQFIPDIAESDLPVMPLNMEDLLRYTLKMSRQTEQELEQ